MNITTSNVEQVLCAYCGSKLVLSAYGRCAYCDGPYSYVIVKEEKKFEIRPSIVGQTAEMDYSINTFYLDLLKYKELGIIVGNTYTGKTSVLANFVNSIDDNLKKIVISPEPWDFNNICYSIADRVVPNTCSGQLRNYTMTDLKAADVVVVDDFDMVFRYIGDKTTLPNLVRERFEFLSSLYDKPMLISVNKLLPYLEYRAKWVAEVTRDGLTFKMIKGQKSRGE
jgi:hypothetical protein